MMATKRERRAQPAVAPGEYAVESRPARLPASTLARLRCTRGRTLLWTFVAAVLLAKAAVALWTALIW